MGQYRQGHRTEKVGGMTLWDNIDSMCVIDARANGTHALSVLSPSSSLPHTQIFTTPVLPKSTLPLSHAWLRVIVGLVRSRRSDRPAAAQHV